MEQKSTSRKRSRTVPAMPTRSNKPRLNRNGDRWSRRGGDEGSFVETRDVVKDMRVHRIFTPSLDEMEDCDVADGSGICFEKSVGESVGGEVVQDCVQTTPPDEVLGGGKIVDFSEKVNVGRCGQRQAVRRTTSPGSKVLGCSRTKLFGNPNSFSYRRLLPYLMDITKGALKSFDMKPLLLKNAGNSAVESSLPAPEKYSCETDSRSVLEVESPSRISEPTTCTLNTADMKVPLNTFLRDQEELVPIRSNSLGYGLAEVIVDENDKLSEIENFTGVFGCMAACGDGKDTQDEISEPEQLVLNEAISGSSFIDPVTQPSPGDNQSDGTNVLGDALSCKHQDLSDAHKAVENVVNSDNPQSDICKPADMKVYSQNNCKPVQRTPIINDDLSGKNAPEKAKTISELENKLDESVITNIENSVCEQISGPGDNKQSLSSDRKLYLKPRRLKRFKNYNSVSYRKLLPYLTEIYEDNAGVSIKKSHPASVCSTTFLGGSSPVSAASCDVKSELTNSEPFTQSDVLTDSPSESPLSMSTSCRSDEECMGDIVEKLQCTAPYSKDEGMSEKKKVYLQDSNIISGYPEPISPCERPCESPRGGILQKHPRGCRGLCTCLKCASFRLHAEKAFEFSSNQLIDSEEIALELMSELSSLRNLLKKSIDAEGGEVSQVQEACRRADIVEQHAKARFKQMNHDLRIHCQIPNLQRPRVSFARHFEEIIIPTDQHPS